MKNIFIKLIFNFNFLKLRLLPNNTSECVLSDGFEFRHELASKALEQSDRTRFGTCCQTKQKQVCFAFKNCQQRCLKSFSFFFKNYHFSLNICFRCSKSIYKLDFHFKFKWKPCCENFFYNFVFCLSWSIGIYLWVLWNACMMPIVS